MSSSWESPPLHRHLSTIGIGPVFVRPPPHALPTPPVEFEEDPKKDGGGAGPGTAPKNTHRNETETWEIVGDIKSTPEDFVVREIGWAPPMGGAVEPNDDKHNGNDDENAVEHSSASDAKQNAKKYKRRPGWRRTIAGLECENQTRASANAVAQSEDVRISGSDEAGVEHHDREPTLTTGKTRTSTIEPVVSSAAESIASATHSFANTRSNPLELQPKPTISSSKAKNEDASEIAIDPNPMEGLRQILCQCHDNHKSHNDRGGDQTSLAAEAGDIMKQLTDLQRLALDEIDRKHSTETNDTGGENDGGATVWIPTVRLKGKEYWALLHRYLRKAFPLLRTESSSLGPDECRDDNMGGNGASDPGEEGQHIGINDNSWVKALIDYTFFPIAPHLSNPREDLLLLYKFRNHGPVQSSEGDKGRCRERARFKHRKRPKNNERNSRGGEATNEEQPGELSSSSDGKTSVRLRLRPDLPRSERRAVHQLLASGRRRNFDTSTENNVPLDATENAKQTSAIVVWWSFNAVRSHQKKRKRTGPIGNGSDPRDEEDCPETSSNAAVLCVLRKYQCEHQVAFQNVARALRCRAGDIGLAGIKDMQAITYQYCTLRNADPKAVQRANDTLGKRVQLSGCVGVRNFLLDRGHLLGNRFEIVIRNLKRVRRRHAEGDEPWEEQTVPLQPSHIDAMVKRVEDFGFINFYGEQRVGDAGFRRRVGVRSFDVGRAMLQRDFALAIDLIMTGRSSQVYSPGEEEKKAREVWKTSDGDARATLKAFPKNRNTMVRERDLLKGLLRYGKALDAIRCVPHNVRMFWVHSYQVSL